MNKYDDIIDSRDLKEFIDELEGEEVELTEEEKEIREEAKRLFEEYGNDFILIRYSYAENYIEDFVRDCYSIPKDLDWLFYHIDWEGVVRDFCMGGNWYEDEFCGITYYVEMR